MVILTNRDEAGTPPLHHQRPLQVGFYEIIKTLGKGTFAVVKLARHKVTKTQVAIKIIDKTRLNSSDLEKINREVQIMKLLNHPHIIKLYQVMETKDMLYIVTEYAQNGEMFEYLSSVGRLAEGDARRKFWQIVNAVEYCHQRRIIHRDLKAENLLLDINMNVKLADFGFGNFYKPGEMLSTWCGSPPYAAPEVFEGKPYEGPKLDIWSLGVVLYVLVSGTLPFDGDNLYLLRQRVTKGHFRVPFFMSQECENLIRKMLTVNPARRISIAEIKQHRWMQADPAAAAAAAAATQPLPPSSPTSDSSQGLGGYSEHILSIMQSLGVERQRTIESLQSCSYNHFSAMYCLLLERVKHHISQQHSQPEGSGSQPQASTSGPSLPDPPPQGEITLSGLLVQSEHLSPVHLPKTRIVDKDKELDTLKSEKCEEREQTQNVSALDSPWNGVEETTQTSAKESICNKLPRIVVQLVGDDPSDSCSAPEEKPPSLGSFISSIPLPPSTGAECRPVAAEAHHQGSLRPHPTPLRALSQSSKQEIREQASLAVPSFNEGRRASDTLLSPGPTVSQQPQKTNVHTEGPLALTRCRGLLRPAWLQEELSRPMAAIGAQAFLHHPLFSTPTPTRSWEFGPRQWEGGTPKVHRGHQLTQLQFQHKPLAQLSPSQKSQNLQCHHHLLSGPPSPPPFPFQCLLSTPFHVQKDETLPSPCDVETLFHLSAPCQHQPQPLPYRDFTFSFGPPSPPSESPASAAALLETKLQISPESQTQHRHTAPTLPSPGDPDDFLAPPAEGLKSVGARETR
ncbi:hypothetical protein ACEWY4_016380 [Coilia grayii]|uniref:non-specific serine/threonine protein kinase n=1 Tax=Coilia grayii TaxID=363190 RepID=A0ABD1JKD7_9TELE